MSGCVGPYCPQGYDQIDNKCYRRKDAGAADAGDDERDATQGDADATDADDGRETAADAGQEKADTGSDDSNAAPADAAPAFDGEGGSDAAATDAGPVRCDSLPCQNSGSCRDTPDGFMCSCPKPFLGERCEAWSCTTTTLRTEDDLARARPCGEIDGDLIVASAGIAAVTASDLPSLTRITGNLSVSGMHNNGVQTPRLREFTLANLREIGGELSVSETGPNALSEIRFPALTRVEGGLHFYTTATRHLELSALHVVGEAFYMHLLPQLCTLEIGAIEPFTNVFYVDGLVNLPSSALEPVRRAFSGSPILDQGIGCCFPTDRKGCPPGPFTDAVCGCSAP